MMESFGLYEDLSLFSGDLLVGINPLADELPGFEQDGGFQEVTKIQPHVDLFSDGPIKPSSPDPVQDNWMDKKMDLIKLLSSPNVQITIQDVPSSDNADVSSAEFIDLNTFISPATEKIDELQSDKTEGEVSHETLLSNFTDLLSADLDESGQYASTDISFSGLGDEIGDFSTDGLASLLSEEDINALSAPILSPVSPQDIESILSSGPASPESTASINDAVVPQIVTVNKSSISEQDWISVPTEDCAIKESSAGPVRSVRASRMKKYQPYRNFEDDTEEYRPPGKSSRSGKPADRKERKKQQNKDAALRYRQKKKQELNGVFGECDELEKKNEDLKEKVESMTREIQYLKDLLLEVYKAKGMQPKGLLCK